MAAERTAESHARALQFAENRVRLAHEERDEARAEAARLTEDLFLARCLLRRILAADPDGAWEAEAFLSHYAEDTRKEKRKS